MFKYFKFKKLLKELEDYLHFQLISNDKGKVYIGKGLINGKHSLTRAKATVKKINVSSHAEVIVTLEQPLEAKAVTVISSYIRLNDFEHDIKSAIDGYYENLYVDQLKCNIDSNMEELKKVLHVLKYDVTEIYKESKMAKSWGADCEVELGFRCNFDGYLGIDKLNSVMICVKLEYGLAENPLVPVAAFDFNQKGNFDFTFDDMSETIKSRATEILDFFE